jgi:hypothetical protein
MSLVPGVSYYPPVKNIAITVTCIRCSLLKSMQWRIHVPLPITKRVLLLLNGGNRDYIPLYQVAFLAYCGK